MNLTLSDKEEQARESVRRLAMYNRYRKSGQSGSSEMDVSWTDYASSKAVSGVPSFDSDRKIFSAYKDECRIYGIQPFRNSLNEERSKENAYRREYSEALFGVSDSSNEKIKGSLDNLKSILEGRYSNETDREEARRLNAVRRHLKMNGEDVSAFDRKPYLAVEALGQKLGLKDNSVNGVYEHFRSGVENDKRLNDNLTKAAGDVVLAGVQGKGWFRDVLPQMKEMFGERFKEVEAELLADFNTAKSNSKMFQKNLSTIKEGMDSLLAHTDEDYMAGDESKIFAALNVLNRASDQEKGIYYSMLENAGCDRNYFQNLSVSINRGASWLMDNSVSAFTHFNAAVQEAKGKDMASYKKGVADFAAFRDFAQGKYSPYKKASYGRFLNGVLDFGNMIPFTIGAAVSPYAVMPALIGRNQEEAITSDSDGKMLMQFGASTIGAGIESWMEHGVAQFGLRLIGGGKFVGAAGDRIGKTGLFRKFEQGLGKIKNPITRGAVGGTVAAAADYAGEFSTEKAQDFANPVAQELVARLGRYNSGINWKGVVDNFLDKEANIELAYALLPMALIVGGGKVVNHSKACRYVEKNMDLAKTAFGITEEQDRTIAAIQNTEERIAVFQATAKNNIKELLPETKSFRSEDAEGLKSIAESAGTSVEKIQEDMKNFAVENNILPGDVLAFADKEEAKGYRLEHMPRLEEENKSPSHGLIEEEGGSPGINAEEVKKKIQQLDEAGLPVLKLSEDEEASNPFYFESPVTGERLFFETRDDAINSLSAEWERAQQQFTRDMVTAVNEETGDFLDKNTPDKANVKFSFKQEKAMNAELFVKEYKRAAKSIEARLKVAIETGELPRGTSKKEVRILGQNLSRFVKNGNIYSTQMIYKGASPLTVFEERSEGLYDFFTNNGYFTQENALNWLKQLNAETGENFLHYDEKADKETRNLQIKEGWSNAATAYAVGNLHDERLPDGLRKWFRMIIQSLSELFRPGGFYEMVKKSRSMKNSEERGALDAQFMSYLSDSVGMNWDKNEERMKQREQADMLAEASGDFEEIQNSLKGRLPHWETAKENGDPLWMELKAIYDGMITEGWITARKRDGSEGKRFKRTFDIKARQYFLPKGEYIGLDLTRRAMNELGYDFETISEMLDSLNDSVLHGKMTFGVHSFALDDETNVERPTEIKASEILHSPAEARSAVDKFKGRVFRNKSSGIQAVVTNKTKGKAATFHMTAQNLSRFGFSEEDSKVIHYSAMGKISDAFENSREFFFEKNYKEDNYREGAYHFLKKISVEGYGDFLANISAIKYKEAQNKNTLYCIELTIENPMLESGSLDSGGQVDNRAHEAFENKISSFQSFVEKKKITDSRSSEESSLSMALETPEQNEKRAGKNFINTLQEKVESSNERKARVFKIALSRIRAELERQDFSKNGLPLERKDESGRDVLKRTANVMRLVDAILSSLPKGLLHEVYRGPGAKKDMRENALLHAGMSEKAFNRNFVHIIERVNNVLEREAKRYAASEIENLMDKMKPRREKSGIVKGRMSNEAEDLMKRVVEFLDMSEEKSNALLDMSRGILDNPQSSEADKMKALEDIKLATVFVGVMDKSSGGNYVASSDKMLAAVDLLKDLYSEGRLQKSEEDKARKERLDGMKKKILDYLGVDGGVHINEKGANAKKEGNVKGWYRNLLNFEQVLGDSIGEKNQIAENTVDRLRKCRYNFNDDKQIILDQLFKRAKTIFQTNRHGVSRQLAKMMKPKVWKDVLVSSGVVEVNENITVSRAHEILEIMKKGDGVLPDWAKREGAKEAINEAISEKENAESKLEDIKARLDELKKKKEDGGLSNNEVLFRKKLLGKVSSLRQLISGDRVTVKFPYELGEKKPLVKSEQEVMTILMLSKQEEALDGLAATGLTQEAIEKLDESLSEEAHQLMYAMMEIYRESWDMFNEVHRRMYYTDLGKHENYSPMHRESQRDELNNLPDNFSQRQSILSIGAIKARRNNALKLDIRPAWQMFYEHFDKMLYWKNHAEFIRDVSNVLENKEVMNAIDAKRGKGASRRVSNWIDSISCSGNLAANLRESYRSFINLVVSGMAMTKLGFNVLTMIKQFPTAFAFVNEHEGPVEAFKMLGHLFTWDGARKKIKNEAFIRQRERLGVTPELRNFKEIGMMNPTMASSFLNVGIDLVGKADAYFTKISAGAMYSYAFAKAKREHGGISDFDADQLAKEMAERSVSRHNQPIENFQRSLTEINAGAFTRLMFIFRSDMRRAIAGVLYNLFKEGWTRKSAPGRITRSFTNGILPGLVAPVALFDLALSIFSYYTAPEDDKDKEDVNDALLNWIRSGMTDMASGAWIIGDLYTMAYDELMYRMADVKQKGYNDSLTTRYRRTVEATEKLFGEDELETSEIIKYSANLADSIATVASGVNKPYITRGAQVTSLVAERTKQGNKLIEFWKPVFDDEAKLEKKFKDNASRIKEETKKEREAEEKRIKAGVKLVGKSFDVSGILSNAGYSFDEIKKIRQKVNEGKLSQKMKTLKGLPVSKRRAFIERVYHGNKSGQDEFMNEARKAGVKL